MKPTKQQQSIIDYHDNSVIIAAPGSGKTFVISEKVRYDISELYDFQGVIAISYTNKASNELKTRCLKDGFDARSSFFGTIDSFFISEIIIPFGKHLWGIPENSFNTIKLSDIQDSEQIDFSWLSRDLEERDLKTEYLDTIGRYFKNGILILESVGVIANFIFTQSKACKKYFKARYKAIYIDEYQDSGLNQHTLFIKLTKLGIIGVAVGDINQSIYGFSGKDSRYLNLLSNNKEFSSFLLNKNHRCHPSIINYSNHLLNSNTHLFDTNEIRVFKAIITGAEASIAKWIDSILDWVKKKYNIFHNSQIAILGRSTRTIEIIDNNLKAPHKLSKTTNLELSLNIWSGIFVNLLRFALDDKYKFIEIIEAFTSWDHFNSSEKRTLIESKQNIKNLFEDKNLNHDEIISVFKKVSKIIAPESPEGDSLLLLEEVLSDKSQLNAFLPVADHEVQIMTLHKSKGLEFDLVIHLDLNEWILPSKGPTNGDWNNPCFPSWTQDINLHYVGITRAKEACFLLTSTQRSNSRGGISQGSPSEFFLENNLNSLRIDI